MPHYQIGMLLFPRLTQLDLTGPYEVMCQMPDSTTHLIAATLEPVQASHGLTITPTVDFENAPQLDILMVPGGPGINAMLEDDVFLEFLRQQGQHAKYVTAVCTGSLLLAAAGLLDGYKATTHWRSLDLLQLFGVEVLEERVVIDRNRITGGGVTAGIDFGLVMVAEICGEEVAKQIQLAIEYNPAPPFRAGSPEEAEADIVALVKESTRANQDKRKTIIERILNAR